MTDLTVRDLRRRWKPHKERLAQLQPDHPTAVRFHRACSWLDQAQRLDGAAQADLVLIQQWTAFNALYGCWNAATREPAADRQSWKRFLERLLKLDQSQHLLAVLQTHKPLVLTILENAYLNSHFWEDPSSEVKGRCSNARFRAQSWYVERRWLWIAEQLLERIYLLRCQLVHGAATCGSQLNREALRHCTTMLGHLLPAMLQVWIDHGADEDWGPLCYPPQDNRPATISRVRPR